MHIHILGICGTFMGGLALIARAAGHKVTGCDANVYPPMSTQLEEQGIEIIQGFAADQTSLNPDLYIIGNVVTRGNPLMEAILDQKLAYISGPQWLGENILRDQHVVAIAGTHGKTTTTAMTAWILDRCGRQPNFLVGGVAADLKVSARFSPDADVFVIEADEYDTAFFDKRSKFLHYHPDTLVINNMEFDHADIFENLQAIQKQFHHVVRIVPSKGLIISPETDANIQQTLQMGCWSQQEHVGASGWQAHLNDDSGSSFEVQYQNKEFGRVEWGFTGLHNVHNALAAIAACRHCGVEPREAIEALNQFQGIKRRMELLADVGGIHIYDDFAHHPTAIRTTLDGLRNKLGKDARIVAVLEPRSNTMKLGTMAERLPDALSPADLAFCYVETHGKHALGWKPQEIFAKDKQITCYDDTEDLIRALCKQLQPGDHVVIMSNGSFNGLHKRLITALQKSQKA